MPQGKHCCETLFAKKMDKGHPSQERVLDPPSSGTFSTPLRCHCWVIPVHKKPRGSRAETLVEGSKNFQEGGFSGTFCLRFSGKKENNMNINFSVRISHGHS